MFKAPKKTVTNSPKSSHSCNPLDLLFLLQPQVLRANLKPYEALMTTVGKHIETPKKLDDPHNTTATKRPEISTPASLSGKWMNGNDA